jgi:hypothetical protein
VFHLFPPGDINIHLSDTLKALELYADIMKVLTSLKKFKDFIY